MAPMPQSAQAAHQPFTLESDAQAVLNDLLRNELIPFKLTAHKVDCLGKNEYIVRFYDARLRSVDVTCQNNGSFQDALRVAVLDRVATMRDLRQ